MAQEDEMKDDADKVTGKVRVAFAMLLLTARGEALLQTDYRM